MFSPGDFQGLALVNQQRSSRISTGFSVEVSTEGTQLSYSSFDYLGQEPHYWQLPGAYQGNKVSPAPGPQDLALVDHCSPPGSPSPPPILSAAVPSAAIFTPLRQTHSFLSSCGDYFSSLRGSGRGSGSDFYFLL